MTRARAAAAPLLLGLAACQGTLAASGAARVETRIGSVQAPVSPAVRMAPELAWRPVPGAWAAGARYTPTLAVGGGTATLLRHRLAADFASAREAGVRPFAAATAEYGEARTAELLEESGETLTPQPDRLTLRSYAFRAEGGVRGYLSRRTRLQVGGGVDRSGGLGASAGALPALARVHASARAQHRLSRSDRLEAALALSHARLDGSRLLVEGDARATRQVTPRVSASLVAGGGAVHGAPLAGGTARLAVRPAAGVAVAWAAPGSDGARAAFALATRPELDRLTGGLQQRLHGQVSAEVGVRPGTRAVTRVQWASDLAGEGVPRRALTLRADLRTELPRGVSVEVGGAVALQNGADGALRTPADGGRIHLGVTRRARGP